MKKNLVGYFEDFEEPTILFSGSKESLLSFSMLLEKVADLEIKNTWVNELELFEPARGVKLLLQVSDSKCAIEHFEDEEFRWFVTKPVAKYFADLIRAVALSEVPCHQYLECNSNDQITVIVSMGEYPQSIFLNDCV